jgi:hypothetical protein
MRLLLLFITMLLLQHSGAAAVAPASTTFPEAKAINRVSPEPGFLSLRLKDVRKILGRKLTLKEKIAFKVFQWKIKKGVKFTRAEKVSKKGKAALILGIVALATLFIPFVNIFTLPAAILAIVFGNSAKRENPEDKQARVGVLLGWITIGLIMVILVIALALLSSSSFWF